MKRLVLVLMMALAVAGAALAAPERALPDGSHAVSVSVPDMECSMCIRSVQVELKHLSGIVEIKIDDVNRVVNVRFDPTATDVRHIQGAIRKAGFASKLVEPAKS